MDNKSIKKSESNPDFKVNFQFDENIVTKDSSIKIQNTSKPKENEKIEKIEDDEINYTKEDPFFFS